MSHCCVDPTEIPKADPRDVVREQVRYGDLVRELFTSDPEKLMLYELREENTDLRGLSALRAHYPLVRLAAITMLEKFSFSVLQRIIDKEQSSQIGGTATRQLQSLQ